MRSTASSRWKTLSVTLIFSVFALGCAAERMAREGNNLIAQGQLESGLDALQRAVKLEPDNVALRTQLINKRSDILNRLLMSANSERASGHFDEAENLYRRMLNIDATNERARDGLESLSRDRRHGAVLDQARTAFNAGNIDKALALLAPVASENPDRVELLTLRRAIQEQQAKDTLAVPTLKALSQKPVSLEFRDANLKMVFEVLSRTSGINFILDKDVRSDLKTTLFLKQSSLEDAVDLLLATNQLEKKVLNQNSVLIYPNTPAKLKDYQDLVVKSFYLANADVKQTQAMIKTMLKTKDLFIDEKLNLLIMRDSPEAIRLAEKLIAMQDISEPEVMLEVEVLEVKRSRLLDLGIQYPSQLTLTPLPSATLNSTIIGQGGTTTTNPVFGPLTLSDLRNLNSSRIGATISSTMINLKKEDGDASILANPRIRARNREKAKIMIGDKVPTITTNVTSTGVISENVQYVDVGLKLEVEPNIYLQDDVAIRIGLEVSSIVREIRSSTGSLSYQIGTRNASTVLRLKDGETQVLAGLISDEDRSTASKVPGLGDLPVLGRLFSSHRDDTQKTEIVLSITPRLIRNIKRPDAAGEEFWSGTEAALRTKPLALPEVKPVGVGPAASGITPTAMKSQAAQVNPAAATPSRPVASYSSAPAMVSLAWQGPAQVKAGEQFKVALKLKTDGMVRSLPIQVGFDPKVVQVIEATEGEFFKQGGAKTNFTSNTDLVGGKTFIGVARATAEGATGDADVAVITFKALAPSRTEIKLLAATPIGPGNAPATPTLPTPFVVTIGN